MSSAEYVKELQDLRWLRLRADVIERDLGRCVVCGDTSPLVVHHLYYLKGRRAWEYPCTALVTLCRKHHTAAHNPFRPLDLKKFLRYITLTR